MLSAKKNGNEAKTFRLIMQQENDAMEYDGECTEKSSENRTLK